MVALRRCLCAVIVQRAVTCGGGHRWQARLDAVAAARRHYARALRLRPASGAAWGDAAATLYQEAQLRRASEAFQPGRAGVLRRAAQRLIRGALGAGSLARRSSQALSRACCP